VKNRRNCIQSTFGLKQTYPRRVLNICQTIID
jgi:hypothetical protein